MWGTILPTPDSCLSSTHETPTGQNCEILIANAASEPLAGLVQSMVHAMQRQMEKQAENIADMDTDMPPASQPEADDGSDAEAVAGLTLLAGSLPAKRPAAAGFASQGKRVRFSPDSETLQAGATLTGLGVIAHGPRTSPKGPRASAQPSRTSTKGPRASPKGPTASAKGPAPEGLEAIRAKQQPDQLKKGRGRPKGAKNKPKPEAVLQSATSSEASGAMSPAESAPKPPKLPRPSAKKRKIAPGPGPSQNPAPPAKLHCSDSVTSPLCTSSSHKQAVPSLDVGASESTHQQAQGHPPSSSVTSWADLAAAFSQPPPNRQQPSQQAQKLPRQLRHQSSKQQPHQPQQQQQLANQSPKQQPSLLTKPHALTSTAAEEILARKRANEQLGLEEALTSLTDIHGFLNESTNSDSERSE